MSRRCGREEQRRKRELRRACLTLASRPKASVSLHAGLLWNWRLRQRHEMLRRSRTSRSGAQSMASCLPRSQLVMAAAVARCWIPMEPPCLQPCFGQLYVSFIPATRLVFYMRPSEIVITDFEAAGQASLQRYLAGPPVHFDRDEAQASECAVTMSCRRAH